MEGADVEAVAQFAFGLLTDLAQADFADLVGRGLTRPADVALKLGFDVVRGQG
ncbi:hypothetical protein D3C86_1438450 [compost metagenome]